MAGHEEVFFPKLGGSWKLKVASRAQMLSKAGVKLLAASVRAENPEMIQFILSHNL